MVQMEDKSNGGLGSFLKHESIVLSKMLFWGDGFKAPQGQSQINGTKK